MGSFYKRISAYVENSQIFWSKKTDLVLDAMEKNDKLTIFLRQLIFRWSEINEKVEKLNFAKKNSLAWIGIIFPIGRIEILFRVLVDRYDRT